MASPTADYEVTIAGFLADFHGEVNDSQVGPPAMYRADAEVLMADLAEAGYAVVRSEDLRYVFDAFIEHGPVEPEDYEVVERLWQAVPPNERDGDT